MLKNLYWFGPTYSYSGYAQHNRAMIFELLKLGWNIQLVETETQVPDGLLGKELLKSITAKQNFDRRNTISLNLVPPPSLPFYAGYNILFTTMESKTVHPGFYNRCTLFDELWFPCKENVKSFKRTKWNSKRIYYCPEGVYPNFWSPAVPKNPDYVSDDFTFFYNGDWSFRKGVDVLIRAYAQAFKASDPVRLLLLVHYQGHNREVSERVILNEIAEFCRRNKITSLPKIDFIFDHIPDKDMPAIYACSDVYVCPTRGEAWGLPIIQAMSCGKPVIVTSKGGHVDFCNEGNSLFCDLEKMDIMDDKVNLTVDFYKKQLFWFPDPDHFSKLLKFAFENQLHMNSMGDFSREFVSKHFTWTHSARYANSRLEEIYENKNRYFRS